MDSSADALAKSIARWYKNLFSMSKEEKLKAIDDYIRDKSVPATDEEIKLLKRYMTSSDEATVKSVDDLSINMQTNLANLSLGLAAYVNGKTSLGLKWASRRK